MPGTAGGLIQAAKNSFIMRSGPMCHDAVFEWLQNAGYVDGNAHRQVFGIGDRSSIFAEIMVSETDPIVTSLDHFAQLPGGTIIGFWKDKKIMHSVITLGNRMLAGANNAGIFDPAGKIPKVHDNLRSLFLLSQIKWHPHNATAGMDGFTTHYQTADVIAARINAKANSQA